MPDAEYIPRPTFESLTANRAGSEYDVLFETLHNLRSVVAWKLANLDDATAKASVVPSATTLLGLVHHLA